MAETERVVMLWPKELKEKVRETAGKRGITEFTVKAVGVHLGVDEDLTSVEKELNDTKYLVQQLADQLVLGVGSPEERLQAFMELEFPEWVDTSGWPPAFADRVRPAPIEAVEEEAKEVTPAPTPPEPKVIATSGDGSPVDGLMDHFGVEYDQMVEAPAVNEEPDPKERPAAVRADKDDLFARVMAKTGGKLSDVPGLKVASAIERPEAKEPEAKEPEPEAVSSVNTCPTCGEELVDGECWTCG